MSPNMKSGAGAVGIVLGAFLAACLLVYFVVGAPGLSAKEIDWLRAMNGPDESWPAGSKIVGGAACFQEQRDGQWVPVQVAQNGAVAVKGQSASGTWYFPATAGPIRVLIGCKQEAR